MSRFNVIWIDDEWQKSASFIDVCKEIHEIDITPFTTSKDGMNALEGNLYHWHGVILDAKVFNESENEIATLAGLQNSIKKIASLSSKRFTLLYQQENNNNNYNNNKRSWTLRLFLYIGGNIYIVCILINKNVSAQYLFF